MRVITILIIMTIMSVGLAGGLPQISFVTSRDIEHARQMIKSKGIKHFVEAAWAEGVPAPGISSKYRVDREKNGGVKDLETARREFGRELARQVDMLAADIYRHPDKSRECERLDWVLRFVGWIGAPCCFENYRIALRTEEAATMDLLRAVMDFSVPDKKIEDLISRFTTLRKSAPIRARILYEESEGEFDIRDLARRASEKEDGFEVEWRDCRVRALRHFDGVRYEYSRAAELLKKEDARYAFFMDDSPGAPYRDSTHWDCKIHKIICVFRAQAEFLAPIVSVFRFRKLIRKFPDVKIPAGEPEYDTYQSWYDREYDWVFRQHRICPSTVAAYYLMFKHNSYTDAQTWETLDKAEQKEIVRTNMLTGPL